MFWFFEIRKTFCDMLHFANYNVIWYMEKDDFDWFYQCFRERSVLKMKNMILIRNTSGCHKSVEEAASVGETVGTHSKMADRPLDRKM